MLNTTYKNIDMLFEIVLEIPFNDFIMFHRAIIKLLLKYLFYESGIQQIISCCKYNFHCSLSVWEITFLEKIY